MALKKTSLVYFPMLIIAAYWGVFKVALPILPALSKTFHVPAQSFQYILSLAFISSGLSPILWGAIIDSIKIKSFIITATVASIIILLLVPFSKNILLFGILYVMGCTVINGLLGCARILPLLYLKEEVYMKRALSLMMFGGYSAAFFAPFVGGWVYHLINWQAVFFVVPIWLLLILLLAVQLDSISQPLGRTTVLDNIKQLVFHLRNKKFLNSLLIQACYGGVVQSYYIAVPFWIIPAYHISPKNVAYYLFPMFFPGMIAPLIFNIEKRFFSDRTIVKFSILLFLLASIIPFLFLFVKGNGWLGVAPAVLMTVGVVGLFPIISFNALDAIEKQHNAASSLFSIMTYSSGGIGIYITSFIDVKRFYLEGVFILVISLLMVFFFVRGDRIGAGIK